ncbi:hypothetical protein G9A89_016611 [Geosiphon pyriformis]|nr:hypothetical protein G9A89_016611 [Geosiphon pyriformis]
MSEKQSSHEVQQIFSVIEDISNKIERFPVSFIYEKNRDVKELRAKHLQYVKHSVTSLISCESYYDGCDCTDNCESSECGCKSTHGFFYDPTIPGLHPSLISPDTGKFSHTIYECNSSCTCTPGCLNRLVQHGTTLPLQIFKTHNKGWGVRAIPLNPSKSVDNRFQETIIKKGQFVCEYAGEIIKTEQVKSRWKVYQEREEGEGDAGNYVLCLKEHIGHERILRTNIDPTFIGNVGRYINHSCSPNLAIFLARVNSLIPIAALFAVRDICAGEELSFDYAGKIGIQDGNKLEYVTKEVMGGYTSREEPKHFQGLEKKPCLCSSEECRGILPFDESL